MPPKAVKRTAVRLPGRMTLEDAFCRLAYNCLAQIEANEAGVLLHDAEALHQMRVGVRRLRALLALYRGLLEPGDALRAGLAWLSAALGPARDWDVLAGSTLAPLEDSSNWDGWSTLRTYAAQQSAEQHEALVVVLGSSRYANLLAGLDAWLEARAWRRHAHQEADQQLDAAARTAILPLLEHAQRRVRKRARKLDTRDADARHGLRIAAKKARYAAEFFQELLPAKRTRRYLRALAAMQAQLGALNDLAAAGRLLHELPAEAVPPEYAAFARGYLEALEAQRLRKLDRPVKRLASLRIVA